MANQPNLGQSMRKMSLEVHTWKCPERETAPKWHCTATEETSAFTEQYQYPTCLSWQSLPDQFKINTKLLKRFRSRTINIKHIPSVQMLILQPQSWWVLGGAQPGWLQRQAQPLAAPLLTSQLEEKRGQKEQPQGGREGAKEADGHCRTSVPQAVVCCIHWATGGCPAWGCMWLLQSNRLCGSKIAQEKKFLGHLR